ncbi:E3 ubiquitin-protein ligase TRIP12-like isoform X2 [Oscarella lobularis]|uniref:E3 ubiquitin-protein ligase TRIP12-like isoform X2 n=1 Tax=Oscarella lobularis TaxID=121494 RepID=UPI0033139723
MSSRSRSISHANEKEPVRRSERLSRKAALSESGSVSKKEQSEASIGSKSRSPERRNSSNKTDIIRGKKRVKLEVTDLGERHRRRRTDTQSETANDDNDDDDKEPRRKGKKGKRPLTYQTKTGSETPKKVAKLGGKGSKSKTGEEAEKEEGMGCACSQRDGESGGGPSANVVAISAPFELSSEEEGESVPSQPVASGSSDQQNAQRSEEGSASRTSNSRSSGGATRDPEDDLGRLHALLEARGIRSELLEALGARGFHLLSRSTSHGAGSKVSQLINGIEAAHDEGLQLQSVIELCQLLVMGNEDTLAGFPSKQAVPALVNLLRMEHNLEIMHHACRALTYMMEALPQSSAVVIEAIPAFLTKLQVIQCMDVAEQALTALEMLSRRHAKAIMQAGGINACLLYLDFFSLAAQRAALATSANCCQFVTKDDFGFVADSIVILSNRLNHSDKKSVESVCLSFSRLIENLHAYPKFLRDLAACDLLKNVQQLVVTSPPIITPSTFTTVIHMLTVMCGNCPPLAVQLLKQNMADTLQYLLIGTPIDAAPDSLELISRSPGELFELVSLISVMLPKLPSDGLFSVNAFLGAKDSPLASDQSQMIWEWQDDGGLWHRYNVADTRTIENAYLVGEEEVELSIMGQTYVIEFQLMQQFNEETGTARPVQKRLQTEPKQTEPNTTKEEEEPLDDRKTVFTTDFDVVASFTSALFPPLYVMYNSSPGPGIRYKCLNCILGMFYYTSADVLRDLLRDYPISSHVASMLDSSDQKIVVRAFQMANILIQKLPDTFQVHFRREGVMHQIEKLASTGETDTEIDGASSSGKRKRQFTGSPPMTRRRTGKEATSRSKSESSPLLFGASGSPTATASSSSTRRLFKGQKQGKKSKETKGKLDEKTQAVENKEKINNWITEEAKKFHEEYFSSEHDSHAECPELDVMARLEKAVLGLKPAGTLKSNTKALKDILTVIVDSDLGASSFEILHSGLIPQLLTFLASSVPREKFGRCTRAKLFLHVFAGLPEPENPLPADLVVCDDKSALSSLVQKLQGCLSQLEQFQVRVQDASGSATVAKRSQTMQFFNTHQIQCLLQRDRSAASLKEWKSGPVRIDPLASVHTIERYLYLRGFAKAKQGDESHPSELEDSDDEIDDSMAFGVHGASTMPTSHKLEFTLNGHLLPYSMTMFQAVKQYGKRRDEESEESGDEHNPLGRASIWMEVHTIRYRPTDILEKELEDVAVAGSSTATRSPRTRSSKRKSRAGRGWRKAAKAPANTVAERPVPLLKRVDSTDLTVKKNGSLMNILLQHAGKDTGHKDKSSSALCLLRVLYLLNNKWPLLYDAVDVRRKILPTSEFVNSKLTAKATRQLQDPFVIMTGNFPTWLVDLTKSFQFLFPFECRQQLFFSSAFDRDRAMARLQEQQPELTSREPSNRFVPRLDKRKRAVSRTRILRQAEAIMNELGSSRSVLEVSFSNEVGTGLGPTLEFYTLVSRELQRADLKMWRGEEYELPEGTTASEETRARLYIKSPGGLFPACMTIDGDRDLFVHVLDQFRFLGKFLAKSMLDSRMVDLPLSVPFYKWMLGQESALSPADLWDVDPVLAKSYCQLRSSVMEKRRVESNDSLSDEEKAAAIDGIRIDESKIEDLDLDFTLPGNRDIELKPGGRDVLVTIENLDEYLELVWRWTLIEGVSDQFKAFREGFASVFPLSALSAFYPHELELLLCGSDEEKWDIRVLVDNCRPDHGYTHDSRAVQMLFEIMSSYDLMQRRCFVQFVTGCPHLPVGGFRSLNPPLTIVRKTIEPPLNPDDFLPSVMTCVNYLKLPDYSSKATMTAKLKQAALEGQHSFHLS